MLGKPREMPRTRVHAFFPPENEGSTVECPVEDETTFLFEMAPFLGDMLVFEGVSWGNVFGGVWMW